MLNVYSGILLVLISTIGYVFSFKMHKRNKDAVALSVLVLCGFALRAYTSADLFLHAWDERYHALVAKHLTQHFFTPTLYEQTFFRYDYMSWTVNHIWLHKQPLTLWMMAASLKVFGLHVWAVRIPSVLLSTIAVKLVYDICKYLYNRETAFFAAFLCSIHGLVIELSAGRVATDHVDVALFFFVLFTVWFGIKNATSGQYRYAFLAGLSLGCAVLCKWMPALVALPVWALIFYRNEQHIYTLLKHMCLLLFVAAAVVLPWQLYIVAAFPREAYYEYGYNLRHFTEPLSNLGGSVFYHFDYLRQNYGELIYIPVIWFSVNAYRKRNLYDIAILIWFWLPYLFFSVCATKMQAYTILSAPAVFIIAVRSFIAFKEYASKYAKYRLALLTLAYGFILLPVRYTIERTKPFTVLDRDPAWNQQIQAFAASPQNTANTVVFNCQHPIEWMFATNTTCYDMIPDSASLEKLRQERMNVIILKD